MPPANIFPPAVSSPSPRVFSQPPAPVWSPISKWPLIVGTLFIFILIAGVAIVTLRLLQNSVPTNPQSSIKGPQLPRATSTSPTPETSRPVLISAGLSDPKGFNIIQAQEFLAQNGMNLFAFSHNWDDLETSPGSYNIQDMVSNPLTMLVPKYSFKGVLMVIKMIDTGIRTMPSDLQSKSFDDPQVRQRFLAMLHAVATAPGADKLTYILLGNEVDAYFSAHPKELPAFMILLKESVDQLHQDLPRVRVGTITTFDGLNHPPLFKALTEYSDFIDYTYYPINGLSGGNVAKGWQMRPVRDVPADLNAMAEGAGSKPFAFTEIGYSASPLNGSSESAQADFVQTVFETLAPYRDQNRVAFISWSGFADYPPQVCQGYAKSQSISGSAEFCAFLGNIGLRTYADNRPRQAWDTFVKEVRAWVATSSKQE